MVTSSEPRRGSPLRIVYFGTPQFAVPSLARLLASRHTIVGVVTQPDRPRGRGQRITDSPVKALALEHRIPVFQPARLREADVDAQLRHWQPDLGVVAAYGKLIPDNLLMLPRLGMINVHASLLPKYRGAAPVHRAVMAGEAETGVTIMRVIRELDAGGMFAKASRPIDPDETSDVIERDLAEIGAGLLVTVVDQLTDGTAREEPQEDALATYAPKVTKEEGVIDWARPARAIHNQVRGLHPWPHAHTFIGAARIIILRTRGLPGGRHHRAPGTVIQVSRDSLHVATGEGGALAIEQLQPQGKRAMPTRDFLAGHPVAAGTVLGAP
jgi:methionyl-tRNA formyltransferase